MNSMVVARAAARLAFTRRTSQRLLTLCASLAVGTTMVAMRAAGAQVAADDVSNLPIRWIEPTGAPSHRVAIILSGDGGFAELVTHLGNGLAARGLGAVMLNSRAFLSPKKSPAEASAAVARIIRAALRRFHADSVVIVGYSRGADLAPFVVNGLSTDLRSRVSAIAMLGLAPVASFEFHLLDLIKDTPRATDIPVIPELLRLRGTPMLCIYGDDEDSSGCRDAPDGLLRKEARKGGHHFDGNEDALLDHILQLIGLNARSARIAPGTS